MGFTIEDMLTISQDRYEMKLVAGKNGWSNSISWIMVLEDLTLLRSTSGKELAITTGIGFDTEEKLMTLAKHLVENHSAGLVINTGKHIMEPPKILKDFCDENDFPLLTVPWRIYLADMIKDLSMHLFFQAATDDMISAAIINAIETPEREDTYRKDLMPHFDVDGQFQVVLFSTKNLDAMDTVERRKLSYRLQIYLENITHNGIFFYYDGHFILVFNDVEEAPKEEILDGMLKRAKRRMADLPIYMGVGSSIKDISNLHVSYQRAKSALTMSMRHEIEKTEFDQMGIYRLLYSISDEELLQSYVKETLSEIIDYDQKHQSTYLETLHSYLRNNGSIQAVSEELFTHRNTVIYRINNIKKLLGSDLSDSEEKMKYLMALAIYTEKLVH